MEDKVYYFVEPYTEYELLQNIYVLLFLFIFGYLFLKFISIIHSVSWKNKRR